jgi:hypothetical protein
MVSISGVYHLFFGGHMEPAFGRQTSPLVPDKTGHIIPLCDKSLPY